MNPRQIKRTLQQKSVTKGQRTEVPTTQITRLLASSEFLDVIKSQSFIPKPETGEINPRDYAK
jgi:hypothetical protein